MVRVEAHGRMLVRKFAPAERTDPEIDERQAGQGLVAHGQGGTERDRLSQRLQAVEMPARLAAPAQTASLGQQRITELVECFLLGPPGTLKVHERLRLVLPGQVA